MHASAPSPDPAVELTLCRARARARAKRRRVGAGLTAIEELLAVAAVAACFVYPLSVAARSSGRQIAAQVEEAHASVLRQR
jgi:hypothetical protein